jgi:hypothetical protein
MKLDQDSIQQKCETQTQETEESWTKFSRTFVLWTLWLLRHATWAVLIRILYQIQRSFETTNYIVVTVAAILKSLGLAMTWVCHNNAEVDSSLLVHDSL